jgi:hypothetical protein
MRSGGAMNAILAVRSRCGSGVASRTIPAPAGREPGLGRRRARGRSYLAALLLRIDALSGSWSAQARKPLTTGPARLVAYLNAGHPNGQLVSRQQMCFLDVLAVDERAVARLQVPDDQRAIELADLTVDPANPWIVQMNVDLGTPADNRRQPVALDREVGIGGRRSRATRRKVPLRFR